MQTFGFAPIATELEFWVILNLIPYVTKYSYKDRKCFMLAIGSFERTSHAWNREKASMAIASLQELRFTSSS